MKDARLYDFINKLKLNLSMEDSLWTQQHQVRDFLGDWQRVLQRYFYLKLDERIEYIRNNLIFLYGMDDKRIQDEINSAKVINKSYWPT
ncbi:MAG TPA: hypothetical protein VFY68_03600 [Nitrososphaeraceae archaeon]|nr:hypothetical protein [Nitrososphaeraceae archaeon]